MSYIISKKNCFLREKNVRKKLLKIMALIVLFPVLSSILVAIKSTHATSDALQPAPFLNNPFFNNGLDGWSRNLLENLGTNIITADSTYGNSAKLYVSGGPAAGDIEQRTIQPILKGTTIVIRVYQTNTANFGAWGAFLYNGTFDGIDPNSKHTCNQYAANVAGATYTPLNGKLTTIVEYTTNRTEGYKTVYWTADRDYPTGTWFVLHGSVWPGTGTFWFLGVYISEEPSTAPFWLQWWFWIIITVSIVAIALACFILIRGKTMRKRGGESQQTERTGIDYKTCPNCGARLPVDSQFCGKCGTRLE